MTLRSGRFRFANRSGGPSDLSRQEASQPKALLSIAGAQFPSLAVLTDEIDAKPDPLPWWIRNSDLIAMALCLCIWIAWGIGEWRLG